MDPRLNSVHLPASRRERFRAARTDLLDACGNQTLAGEREAPSAVHNTAVMNKDKRFPPGVAFVLMDRDCVYPLKSGINTVGRMPDNDVVVADPYVSRRHVAILVHMHNGCEVHDVASKNGTFINGKPITGQAALKPGDKLKLSDHVLLFLSKSDNGDNIALDQTMAE